MGVKDWRDLGDLCGFLCVEYVSCMESTSCHSVLFIEGIVLEVLYRIMVGLCVSDRGLYSRVVKNVV